MTTSEINAIYKETPDYPHTDGFMTHGMSKAVWDEVNKYFAEMGMCSISTFNKDVYSLLKLNYYRNYLAKSNTSENVA